jgi:biotin-dependent carboxylase-like uncharacterized protein
MDAGLEILETGPLSTVQDLGRPGFAGIGVGISGAADRSSFRLANHLAGNAEGTPAVEVTFGRFAARACRDLTIAVTGAPCPITMDKQGVAMNSVLHIPAGSVFRLGSPRRGLRSYVAIHGGIDVAPVLGSWATDLLTGLGPQPLRPGAVLPIGHASTTHPPTNFSPPAAPATDELTLRITPGPRHDWFEESALAALLTEPYTVTSESNRIGIRLDGPVLTRSRHEQLPSEGMVTGALQVPPSGKPTLLLADHPLTGGYPVIAVVASADIDKAAQARPDLRLRFTLTDGCGQLGT